MREIKFRGWDKELNFMINIKRYKIDFNGQVLFDNNDKELYNQTNKIELMQYTGLKDKLKTESFDGDIVKYTNETIATVEWDYINTGWICRSIKQKLRTWALCDSLLDGALVIGNIYENQDLLKG